MPRSLKKSVGHIFVPIKDSISGDLCNCSLRFIICANMKEGVIVGNLSQELMEELETKTAFTIPLFGGIPVPDSCVVTWVIMAVLTLLCIIFVRKLKKVPTGSQCIVETLVDFLDNFLLDVLGPKGKKYLPILETFIIYIAAANLIGVFGFVPPTKDINVTAGLAGMAIILIQATAIIEKGGLHWIKSFRNPINILDLITRPLSLCMRLFGNVLGAFVVMELIKHLIPGGVPVIASLYFDIFDGLIQAYIFVFLTSLFMAEALESE